MNSENEKKLFKEFTFFQPAFGFECGDGWFTLIWNLSKAIQEELRQHPIKNFEVVQVKEKYGELRYYVSEGSEAIFSLIDVAEHASTKICEVCGNPGQIRSDGWIETLCDECNNKK